MSLHEPLLCVVLNDNRDNRDNILFKLCATNFSRLLEKFITQKKLSLLSLLSFKTTQAIIDCLYYKKPEETYCYKNTEETYYYKNTENQYGKKKIKNQYYIKENRESFLPCRIKKKLTPSRTISVLNGVSLFYLFTFLPFYL